MSDQASMIDYRSYTAWRRHHGLYAMKTSTKNLTVCIALLADKLEGTAPALRPATTMNLSQGDREAFAALLADEDELECVHGATTAQGFADLLARWVGVISHRLSNGSKPAALTQSANFEQLCAGAGITGGQA